MGIQSASLSFRRHLRSSPNIPLPPQTAMPAFTVAPVAVKGLALPARKSVAGRAVARKSVVAKSVKTQIVCSKREEKLAAVVAPVAAAALVVAFPEAAHAEVTPSLKNLIGSVFAGGAVLGAIFIAVAAVSQFDSIERK